MRQDILTREFYSDDDRYADLINGLGCDGQQMEEDAYDLAAFYTKTEGLIEKKNFYMEGDKVNMCGAIEGLMEDARIEGRAEGHAEGEQKKERQLLALISAMSADGKTADIPRLSENPDYFREMLKRYSL